MLTRLYRLPIFGCNSCASAVFVMLDGTRNPRRSASNFQRWKQPYLKDLHNRRVLHGPDPLTSRASEQNWNYPSEISALSHRLNVPEMDHWLIVRALTNQSFFEAKEPEEGSSSTEHVDLHIEANGPSEKPQCNEELAEKGLSLFRHIVLSYLRAHWPSAPEEFIVGVAARIASAPALTELANHLSIQHLVRTSEFPPNEYTLHSALLALIGAMESAKARDFVRRFILPRLYEIPMEDVLPFRQPFYVLKDYMYKWKGISDIEARIINSGAVSTALPFYEVAIFCEKKQIVGQSGGEKPWVALDLAAQDGLLRIWRVKDKSRVFPFKFEEVYGSRFENAQQPNHHLRDVCAENTDLSLYTSEELARDPIDAAEVVKQYYAEVKPKLGIPHRRRLRHMFSRGSITRLSLRAFVKPTPHTI